MKRKIFHIVLQNYYGYEDHYIYHDHKDIGNGEVIHEDMKSVRKEAITIIEEKIRNKEFVGLIHEYSIESICFRLLIEKLGYTQYLIEPVGSIVYYDFEDFKNYTEEERSHLNFLNEKIMDGE